MVRIDWRYIKERGDYKADTSKNRGFSLVEVDTRYDIKTVLDVFLVKCHNPDGLFATFDPDVPYKRTYGSFWHSD